MLIHRSFSLSEVITVVVGTRKTAFRVHKDLLCNASKYFQACLNNPQYAEAASGVVDLPEEQPGVVERFIEWLYTQRYDGADLPQLDFDYKFATTRLADTYANAIMDATRTYYRTKNIYAALPRVLSTYEMGLSGTEMGSFVRKSYAWGLAVAGVSVLEKEGKNTLEAKKQFEGKPSVPEAFFDLIQEMISYNKQSWKNPSSGSGCQFHIHHDGGTCPAAAQQQ